MSNIFLYQFLQQYVRPATRRPLAKRKSVQEFGRTKTRSDDFVPRSQLSTNFSNMVRSVCVGDRIDLLALQHTFESSSESGDVAPPIGMSVFMPFDEQVALTHFLDAKEVFLFDFGVIVVWGLSDQELKQVIDSIFCFVAKPISSLQDMERDFVFFSRADASQQQDVTIAKDHNNVY